MTQQAIADDLGIRREAYNSIENGKTRYVKPELKKKLAQFLEMPEDQIDAMDVVVYTHNEVEDGSFATSFSTVHLSADEELVQSVIAQNKLLLEQNKTLTAIVEKLSKSG